MSTHKQKVEENPNADNNSEDQFEVLDTAKANLAVEYKNKAKEFLEKASQDENKAEDKLSEEDENAGRDVIPVKCLKCMELQEQLDNANADKNKACEDLRLVSIELAELNAKYKEKKQTTVDKGELQYAVDSLKQMIKSYEEQNQRLKSFIDKTLNIKGSPSKKNLSQTVESVITDFMVNWQELDRQLTNIQAMTSQKDQVAQTKLDESSYNFYATMSKIDKIKQNILQLQKRVQ